MARFGVGAFRADLARAGATASVEATTIVTELCRTSPEFAALWQDNAVVAHGEGLSTFTIRTSACSGWSSTPSRWQAGPSPA